MNHKSLFTALENHLVKPVDSVQLLKEIEAAWNSIRNSHSVYSLGPSGEIIINPTVVSAVMYVGVVNLVNQAGGIRRPDYVRSIQIAAAELNKHFVHSNDVNVILEELNAANPEGGIF